MIVAGISLDTILSKIVRSSASASPRRCASCAASTSSCGVALILARLERLRGSVWRCAARPTRGVALDASDRASVRANAKTVFVDAALARMQRARVCRARQSSPRGDARDARARTTRQSASSLSRPRAVRHDRRAPTRTVASSSRARWCLIILTLATKRIDVAAVLRDTDIDRGIRPPRREAGARVNERSAVDR